MQTIINKGDQYGQLTVIATNAGADSKGRQLIETRCACGRLRRVAVVYLTRGIAKKCSNACRAQVTHYVDARIARGWCRKCAESIPREGNVACLHIAKPVEPELVSADHGH